MAAAIGIGRDSVTVTVISPLARQLHVKNSLQRSMKLSSDKRAPLNMRLARNSLYVSSQRFSVRRLTSCR